MLEAITLKMHEMGLKQSDLAEMLGLKSPSAVGMMLSGLRKIGISRLKQIALALQMDFNALVAIDEQTPVLTKELPIHVKKSIKPKSPRAVKKAKKAKVPVIKKAMPSSKPLLMDELNEAVALLTKLPAGKRRLALELLRALR